jgi:hypothetical protein
LKPEYVTHVIQTKTARFGRAVFSPHEPDFYSPLPKRRDHHPARRGWVSVSVSVVVSDAGSAGAGDAAGSGWL